MSQRRIRRSAPAVAKNRPSGRNAAALTQSQWNARRCRSLPVWRSNSRTRWSSPTAARSFPAGSIATPEITGFFSCSRAFAGASSITRLAETSGIAVVSARPAHVSRAGEPQQPERNGEERFQHIHHLKWLVRHLYSPHRCASILLLFIGRNGPRACGKFFLGFRLGNILKLGYVGSTYWRPTGKRRLTQRRKGAKNCGTCDGGISSSGPLSSSGCQSQTFFLILRVLRFCVSFAFAFGATLPTTPDGCIGAP